MGIFGVAMMALLICLATGIRRGANARVGQRYNQLPFKGELRTYIGTEERSFPLYLAFQFDELLVLDSYCGTLKTDCASYCNDLEYFIKMYCSPLCQTFTLQNRKSLCSTMTVIRVYDGSSSNASHRTGREWLRRIEGMRTLYGFEWLDQLTYRLDEIGSKEVVYEAGEIHFISAMLFDMRLIEKSLVGGLFGIAPGDHNPLIQMIEKEKFQHRMASFSFHLDHKYRRADQVNRIMTVGALDKANCAEFLWIESASESAWALEATEINFMGMRIPGKTLILLDLSRDYTVIPLELALKLRNADIVQITKSNVLRRTCADPTFPTIEIRTQAMVVSMNARSTIESIYSETCYLHIWTNSTSIYAMDGVWLLGDNILRQFCVALDYERRMIGFAVRRYRAAYHR